MTISIEKKGVVTDCPDCISETHFCKIHQGSNEARYWIMIEAGFDRDPHSITEKEIKEWIEKQEAES